MKLRTSPRNRLATGGRCSLFAVTALAVCVLASSAPVQADIVGVFGGFAGTFPGSFLNGGTLYTEDSENAFHVFSSVIVFDPATRSVAGSGPFTMYLADDTIIQGRWEAKRFKFWKSIGLCRDNAVCLTGGPFGVPFPNNFNAGKMRAKIVLYDSSGNKLGNAVLTIWCSLPGIPYGTDPRDPQGRGIEQYRVKYKGLDFVVGRSGTVFVDRSVP